MSSQSSSSSSMTLDVKGNPYKKAGGWMSAKKRGRDDERIEQDSKSARKRRRQELLRATTKTGRQINHDNNHAGLKETKTKRKNSTGAKRTGNPSHHGTETKNILRRHDVDSDDDDDDDSDRGDVSRTLREDNHLVVHGVRQKRRERIIKNPPPASSISPSSSSPETLATWGSSGKKIRPGSAGGSSRRRKQLLQDGKRGYRDDYRDDERNRYSFIHRTTPDHSLANCPSDVEDDDDPPSLAKPLMHIRNNKKRKVGTRRSFSAAPGKNGSEHSRTPQKRQEATTTTSTTTRKNAHSTRNRLRKGDATRSCGGGDNNDERGLVLYSSTLRCPQNEHQVVRKRSDKIRPRVLVFQDYATSAKHIFETQRRRQPRRPWDDDLDEEIPADNVGKEKNPNAVTKPMVNSPVVDLANPSLHTPNKTERMKNTVFPMRKDDDNNKPVASALKSSSTTASSLRLLETQDLHGSPQSTAVCDRHEGMHDASPFVEKRSPVGTTQERPDGEDSIHMILTSQLRPQLQAQSLLQSQEENESGSQSKKNSKIEPVKGDQGEEQLSESSSDDDEARGSYLSLPMQQQETSSWSQGVTCTFQTQQRSPVPLRQPSFEESSQHVMNMVELGRGSDKGNDDGVDQEGRCNDLDPLVDLEYWRRLQDEQQQQHDGQQQSKAVPSFRHAMASLVVAKNQKIREERNSQTGTHHTKIPSRGLLWLPSLLEGGLGSL